MRLLIAIPIHNEEKYVDRVIDKIKKFHDDLLVIDDGSTDATPELLARRADVKVIRHPINRGYGKSLIDAFAYADAHAYDWVITMDCDEQHEPERIPSFIEAIETDKWDLISGSRYLSPRGDDDLPPGDRQSINATITEMLNDLFDLGITDAFCGYKAHRVSAMRHLRLTETGYAFPLQLWPQIWSAGFRLTEIPVRLIYNDPTRHFGGNLDDAGNRLRHYLDVLKSEMRRLNADPLEPTRGEPVVEVESCCCGK
ncbi:MAG TPA: glycosyltransferase family 2 protein [Tepidisphaeraceae bacterium]|nr:glycosyltransferase family 2 protein [Tepidisphaeraceae bacterium]